MERVIRATGFRGAIEFSNLWRGDSNLRMRATSDSFIEDHAYDDPLVVKQPDDFLYGVSKSAVRGKPLIIGELNQTEDSQAVDRRKAVYSMLPAAAIAYASLQNYAGIVWFAWAHGINGTAENGWARKIHAPPAIPTSSALSTKSALFSIICAQQA